MRVTSFPLGPIETNSYILDDGKNALSIDVGGDPAPILDFLSRENLTLLATIITHQHFDHLYGVHALLLPERRRTHRKHGINKRRTLGAAQGSRIQERVSP